VKSVADLETTIARRLAQTWHLDIGGSEANWPYRINLGQPTSADLEADFSTWSRQTTAIRDWASRHSAVIETRDRRVHGTTQPFPITVTILDITMAADICGPEWIQRVARNETRIKTLRERFPCCTEYPKALRLADTYTDVDFGLLCDVASWFDTNDAAGVTPRQVPIPGVHAKWLNTHGPAVETLIGRPLDLARRHPARIHFTYLDPDHLANGGRRHDCASVGDTMAPAYRPGVVIIVENKDTAIHFPAVPRGIAVEGDGFGGSTAAAFDWIAEAPSLYYWGDIDAAGFEILAGYRREGLAITSILMNLDTYTAYAAWGTNTLPNGETIRRREPKSLPDLTEEERATYHAVCRPSDGLPPRVEQERIPLHVAVAVLPAAKQP
jgi:hypothetical protein